MSKLFPEERTLLDGLLGEWYEAIEVATAKADGIFSDKAKMYDRLSPVWERIKWPHGYVQEIRKKADRVEQLCSAEPINVEEVNEELLDILNYARMMVAINYMLIEREDPRQSDPHAKVEV